LVTNPSKVQQLFVNHFQDLLSASTPSVVLSVDEIQTNLSCTLDEDEVMFISQPFTDKEIQITLFSLANGKSPGPNSFNVDFFKR